jgi:hypothetical protein
MGPRSRPDGRDGAGRGSGDHPQIAPGVDARADRPSRARRLIWRGGPRHRRAAGRARGGALGDRRRAAGAAVAGDVAGGHRAGGARDIAPLLRPRGGTRVGLSEAPARLGVARVAGHRVGRIGAGDAAVHGGVRDRRPHGRHTLAEGTAALRDRTCPRPARGAPEARLLAALRGGDGRRLPRLLREPGPVRRARLGRRLWRPPRGGRGGALGRIYGAGQVRPAGRPLPRPHRRAAAARPGAPGGDSAGAGRIRGPGRGLRVPAGTPAADRPDTRPARAPAVLSGPILDAGLPRHDRGAGLPGHGRRPELGAARCRGERGAGRGFVLLWSAIYALGRLAGRTVQEDTPTERRGRETV